MHRKLFAAVQEFGTALISPISVTELLPVTRSTAAPPLDPVGLPGVAARYCRMIYLVLGFAQTCVETGVAGHLGG
ncbi:hypothetical protein [Nocardia vaccinii]|uniref:hypothetical protein n=1 Tax=Nocardia vaccinii TaxID=1822 RepID=UPI000830E7E5|nr:hypothetical protein [Nocardia vaccinii]